jgi:hypothetical protein
MSVVLTIKNQTPDFIRVAVFKQRYNAPRLNTVAWQVVQPDVNGQCSIPIPTEYVVYVNSGFCETRRVTIYSNQAKFIARDVATSDGAATTVTLEGPLDPEVPNQINIENQASTCVSTHVQKDGSDIYLSQKLAYGQTHEEDVRPTLYVAVINEFLRKGERLVDADITTTPFECLAGDTILVAGSLCGQSGYSFTKE